MYTIDDLRKFCLPKVEQVKYTQIDLDISDLGIADILRSIDTTYPKGGRERHFIESGKLGIIVKCKSEFLCPMEGLILVITNDCSSNIISKNYIVATISEDTISTDSDIISTLNEFTKYMIKEFHNSIEDFHSFYMKYIYDLDMDNPNIECEENPEILFD